MSIKKLILFISTLIIIGGIIWWRTSIGDYMSIAQLKAHRIYLQNFVQDNYIFSVMMYIAFYTIVTILLLPVATVFAIAGGFLFGAFAGVIYANIGATIGAALAFLVVRHLFGIWLQQKYTQELAWFNELILAGGTSYLLAVHFIHIPFFLVNVLAAMTTIPLWTFIWTTSVGIFPGALVCTFAGQQLNTIEHVSDIFSCKILLLFIILALLALLPAVMKQKKKA